MYSTTLEPMAKRRKLGHEPALYQIIPKAVHDYNMRQPEIEAIYQVNVLPHPPMGYFSLLPSEVMICNICRFITLFDLKNLVCALKYHIFVDPNEMIINLLWDCVLSSGKIKISRFDWIITTLIERFRCGVSPVPSIFKFHRNDFNETHDFLLTINRMPTPIPYLWLVIQWACCERCGRDVAIPPCLKHLFKVNDSLIANRPSRRHLPRACNDKWEHYPKIGDEVYLCANCWTFTFKQIEDKTMNELITRRKFARTLSERHQKELGQIEWVLSDKYGVSLGAQYDEYNWISEENARKAIVDWNGIGATTIPKLSSYRKLMVDDDVSNPKRVLLLDVLGEMSPEIPYEPHFEFDQYPFAVYKSFPFRL
jgi:hypothetical protein